MCASLGVQHMLPILYIFIQKVFFFKTIWQHIEINFRKVLHWVHTYFVRTSIYLNWIVVEPSVHFSSYSTYCTSIIPYLWLPSDLFTWKSRIKFFVAYISVSTIYNLLVWLVLNSTLCTIQWTGLVFIFGNLCICLPSII